MSSPQYIEVLTPHSTSYSVSTTQFLSSVPTYFHLDTPQPPHNLSFTPPQSSVGVLPAVTSWPFSVHTLASIYVFL